MQKYISHLGTSTITIIAPHFVADPFQHYLPGSVPGRSEIGRYLYHKLNKNFTTKSVQFFSFFKKTTRFLTTKVGVSNQTSVAPDK